MRFLRKLARGLRRPPKVLLFRGIQETRLAALRHTRGWQRLERSITQWWKPQRIERFLATRSHGILIASDALKTLEQHIADDATVHEECLAWGRRVLNREFEILGASVPQDGELPWHTDWRWDHTWPDAYFRSYDFYGRDRPCPYDIKIPWELSRLWFLPPVLQWAALEPESGGIDWVISVLRDWEERNPLAHTMTWNPMEASMRGISLVLVLEMLLALKQCDPDQLAPVLRLTTSHGEFVWRTVEYTDGRGNHYTANLAALLLLGLTVREAYPKAQRWIDYAVRHIPEEIEQQLYSDGVNFEKSIPYHRLVAELFFLCMLAMQRAGLPLPAVATERLRASCAYSAACTRPDGLTPNVGDNDSARVFAFDALSPRNHGALLGLGAAHWHDPRLKVDANSPPLSVAWLLGREGMEAWRNLDPKPLRGARHFEEGGVVTARDESHFLWVDVGEVGSRGRGGHGHNDLLSFELVLSGHTLIVDPGCPVYTGDLVARDRFRSTAYHNGLRIDEKEIAPLGSTWVIANTAQPLDVEVSSEEGRTTIRGSHTGYLRLEDPVLHTRELVFDTAQESLECTDHLQCQGAHVTERYLHLGSNVSANVDAQEAVLAVGDQRWLLEWDSNAEVKIVPGALSPGYGQQVDSEIIVLADRIQGDTQLRMKLRPQTKEERIEVAPA